MAEEVETTPEQTFNVLDSVRVVLKKSLIANGLARGLHESAKALDKKTALLCVLAADCDDDRYVRLVNALCAHHKIKLITVPEKKKLGEWVGQCTYDEQGNPRGVVKCSCAVIKDFGESSQELNFLQDYLSKME